MHVMIETVSPRTRPVAETFSLCSIRLHTLENLKLKLPLDVILEPDDGGYIARSVDLPLFGFDDDPLEAIRILKNEIESLYYDLAESDAMTSDWVRLKNFLDGVIDE
jgi:ATP-dependent exoDNAse (exonuclease V) beta subunit